MEKGHRCPRARDIGKTCTLKGLLEIFHDIESAKDKMLEANPNLKRRMTIHPSAEKIL